MRTDIYADGRPKRIETPFHTSYGEHYAWCFGTFDRPTSQAYRTEDAVQQACPAGSYLWYIYRRAHAVYAYRRAPGARTWDELNEQVF